MGQHGSLPPYPDVLKDLLIEANLPTDLVPEGGLFANGRSIGGYILWLEGRFVVADAAASLRMIELRKLCQGRVSAYKVPQCYTVVSGLPMTACGKWRDC